MKKKKGGREETSEGWVKGGREEGRVLGGGARQGKEGMNYGIKGEKTRDGWMDG